MDNNRSDVEPDDSGLRKSEARGDEPGSFDAAHASRQDAVAQLAHEIRTPLGAIQMLADVLAEQRFGPIGHAKYLDYARSIREAARHTLALSSRLLAESEGGHADCLAPRVDVDLAAIGRNVVHALVPLARSHDVALTFVEPAEPASIRADPIALRQVAFNLVANAIKHAGGGRRAIVRVARDSASSEVSLEVEDDGPGFVAPSWLRTGDAPPATAPAGLGLPLSARLTRANGGRLTARTAGQTGAVLTATFAAQLTNADQS